MTSKSVTMLAAKVIAAVNVARLMTLIMFSSVLPARFAPRVAGAQELVNDSGEAETSDRGS